MNEQLTYLEALEQLRDAYEIEKIQLTAQISTLQVTIDQQIIHIKQLEHQVKELYKDAKLVQK